MKKQLTLLTCSLTALGPANASVIYTMNGSALFEHDSDGTNSPAPLPSAGSAAVGSTGTFAWGNLSTDTTTNTAEFSGTTFSASDWGGDGTFTSTKINVSAFTEATITATGSSTFNNTPTEFFNFFYQMGDGAQVDFSSGTNPVIDVTGITDLVVGFKFNHDGASDSASVSALSVEAIPEPSNFLLGGLALLSLFVRRR